MGPEQIARHLNAEGAHDRTWRAVGVFKILRNHNYTGYQTYLRTQTLEINGVRRTVPRPSDEWVISDHLPELEIIPVERFNAAQKLLAARSIKSEKAVSTSGMSARFWE